MTSIMSHVAEALLQSEADAIVATDAAGIVTFWNPGAERIFGFNATDVIGESLDVIIPDRLRAAHWKGFHNTMQTGASRYGSDQLLKVPALTKSGTNISVEFALTTLRAADQTITGTVAVLRDVTASFDERRALRQELTMLRASRVDEAPGSPHVP